MIAPGKEGICLAPTPNNLYFPPAKGDYIYFEMPAFDPAERAIVSASRCADAAMLAYARYQQTRMTEADLRKELAPTGFTALSLIGDCFVDNATTARGFFAANDSYALLSFRGTEKGNAADAAADADLRMTAEAGTQVDRGFLQFLNSVWWRVSEIVADYRSAHPNQPIFITGHSLGGALACLAFTRLRDPQSTLITFGCPRVGDRAYCQLIEAAAQQQLCVRVVDNFDVVTHIPLPAIGLPYDHPNIEVFWIDGQGILRVNPPNLPSDSSDTWQLASGLLAGHLFAQLARPVADHSPVRYCQWVGKAV
jgi:hypothetical protein